MGVSQVLSVINVPNICLGILTDEQLITEE